VAMPVDLGRSDIVMIWLVAAGTAALVVMAMTVYVLRLNRSHVRLRAELESQLSALRKIEKALRESEVFYHSLVESLPQSILRKDLEGRFTFGNQLFCKELRRPLAEIVGKTDYDFFPRELAEKYRQDDQRVIEAGQLFETIEGHVTPGGAVLYVQVTKIPLYDAAGKVIGIQGIFWDVTERKSAEDQLQAQNILLQELAESEREAHETVKKAQSRLVQSEKLAGLGQMVAGVAHEINNPLSFVSNNVAVLQRDLGEILALLALYRKGEDVLSRARPDLLADVHAHCERVDMNYILSNLQGLLQRTRDGLGRIQQIVKDLRIFARLDEGERNEVDLNEGVTSTINIVQGHAKKKQVRVEKDLAVLPNVMCYAAKINQVVMNLVMNAIDACPEGGSVVVRTREEGDHVCVDVIDSGCGIEPSIRERIFDPFFTTKPVGVGTGLGLSISYGIVQDHGGSIEVESTPGQGARFTIVLPTKLAAVRRN
jgi:two-component system NtrC family sensor kinase